MSKRWFITGASAGFGFEFVRAAAARGDRVVATSRDVTALQPLVGEFGDLVRPVALDVADRGAAVTTIESAAEDLGGLDVVVNNAGYGQFGRIEELSEAESRDQMDVNFFGPLWITQAALGVMRAQRSGHIVQISSIGGVGAYAGVGIYNASKWGLEAMSEALAQEVKTFGIKVTLVEPGPFRTLWGGANARYATPLPAYVDALGDQRQSRAAGVGAEVGDPVRAAAALLEIVDANDPPLRILLGAMACDAAPRIYDRRLEEWRRWDRLGRSTDHPATEQPVTAAAPAVSS